MVTLVTLVTCLNPGRKAECDPANSWCSTDPGTLWPSAPSAGFNGILAMIMMIVADFPRHLLNYATDMGPEGASLRHFLKVSVCRGF